MAETAMRPFSSCGTASHSRVDKYPPAERSVNYLTACDATRCLCAKASGKWRAAFLPLPEAPWSIPTRGKSTVPTPRPTEPPTATPDRHWYRDLSIRARIFGLTAVLLLGLIASTVTGVVNGNRASALHAESQAAVGIQQQVEAARYNL